MIKADEIRKMKLDYNKLLERNKKAEQMFNSRPVEWCLKYLYLFNEVCNDLSNTIYGIEKATGQHMTTYEKLNGFKL